MSAISTTALAGLGPVASTKLEVASASHSASEQSAVSVPVKPSALYSNPYIFIDPTSNRVVFESRDPETGKLTDQFPSSSQLHAYRLQQSVTVQPAGSSTGQSEIADAQQAKPIAASGKPGIAT